MSDTARWRRVYSGEWHDAAFRSLSDSERIVYFYCRTGPQSTSVGIYRISAALAVEDIGNLTAVEFDYRLDVVCGRCEWQFDAASRVLWMPGWLNENPPQSPNVCVSWRKLLINLPDCDLKFAAAESIARSLQAFPKAFLEAFGSLPKDLRKPKAKPKSKTEANQGAGEQGNQGSGSRGTGASAPNGKTSEVSPQLLSVARLALRVAQTNQDDDLFDAFVNVAPQQGVHRNAFTKAEALNALNVARWGERA